MLDSQLSQISRKAAAVNRQGFLTSVDGDDGGPSEPVSAASTPRSTIASVNSKGGKATFLTRLHAHSSRKEAKDDVGFDVSSPNSRMSTARPDDAAIESNAIEPADERATGDEEEDLLITNTAKNFIKDNISAVKTRRKLTDEEEFRVQSLVDCDEDAFLNHYGISEEQADTLRAIDESLQKFNHMSRLHSDDESAKVPTATSTGVESGQGGKKSDNYLAGQRAAKSKKTYEAAIDLQLSACKEVILEVTCFLTLSVQFE